MCLGQPQMEAPVQRGQPGDRAYRAATDAKILRQSFFNQRVLARALSDKDTVPQRQYQLL